MIGPRNQAISELYHGEGLSRLNIHELDLGDIDLRHNRIRYRSFRQKSKTWKPMKPNTKNMIKLWIDCLPRNWGNDQPLFVALDTCQYGGRLSCTSINRNVLSKKD